MIPGLLTSSEHSLHISSDYSCIWKPFLFSDSLYRLAGNWTPIKPGETSNFSYQSITNERDFGSAHPCRRCQLLTWQFSNSMGQILFAPSKWNPPGSFMFTAFRLHRLNQYKLTSGLWKILYFLVKSSFPCTFLYFLTCPNTWDNGVYIIASCRQQIRRTIEALRSAIWG